VRVCKPDVGEHPRTSRLAEPDPDKKLMPLQGEEIGRLVVQALEGGVTERRPWYGPLEKMPDQPIISFKARGQVVSKSALMDAAWANTAVEESNRAGRKCAQVRTPRAHYRAANRCDHK